MKFILILFVLLFNLSIKTDTQKYKLPQNEELKLNAKSHILMDFDSGEILYSHNEEEKLYPASMTKMMGMLLVLEAIDENRLNWNDIVEGSETSSSMGGTQIFLAPNEKMSVDDLFKAVAINSANDAIVALGEKVSGNIDSFIDLMNKKAKELNMVNTNFKNATGFDNEEHYTTAKDMAILARNLLKHGEDVLRYTRMKEAYIRKDTANPFWLVSTNKLLGNYEGLDGLKTGFTNKAGYNLTATAYRKGVRLISVIMCAKTIKERSQDTVTLLNYGFSKVKAIEIFDQDTSIATFTFKNALTKDTKLYPKEKINPVFPINVKAEDLDYKIVITKSSAPLKANDVVGYLVISYNDITRNYDVVIKEDVLTKGYFDYFFEYLKDMMC